MGKTKKNVVLRTLVCAAMALTACFSTGLLSKTLSAKADGERIATDVKKVETMDGNTACFYLTETDYMTATEWSTESTEAYKWVGELKYEDRENYNVHNAVLDKNLEAYNFAEYIFFDGVALKEYSGVVLMANKWTRVDTFAITFPSNVLSSVQEITIKAGCQIPSLMHSYFGKEFVCLETQEDLIFTYRNGSWAKGYPFDGYEAEVEYDASEKHFYLRHGPTFMGHAEAATCEFTDVFSKNGWGDDGFALASTNQTAEGNLFVADLVHPIDVNAFNEVRLRLFTNEPRTFAVYNASKVTEASLGEPLDTFTIPGKKFSTVTLSTEQYADENGMLDRFVLQFLDNGSKNTADNQFFLGSFSCLDNYYHLSFPLHVQGELSDTAIDTNMVFVNGESIASMNRRGKFVEAKWATNEGYYQIDINVSKDYVGNGAIKNADLKYTGNNITAQKGLLLPSGETLDRTYTYRMYEGENFVDYEVIDEYAETRVTGVQVRIEPSAADNIHFLIAFDREITKTPYYHACETEEWRDESLIVFKGMYDKEVSEAFVSGGFKASFHDNVLINGKTVGEWHAIDELPTCVHVHYGQTNLYTLDMSIDSNSEMYDALYEAFQKGEDITLEIKSGMKFTTSVKTSQDRKFIVNGSSVTDCDKAPDTLKVFYDGREIADGETVVSTTKAMESNLLVQGAVGYTVATKQNGNTLEFTITLGGGETFAFAVQENIVNEIPAEEESGGCASSLDSSLLLVVSALAVVAGICMRRKRYE